LAGDEIAIDHDDFFHPLEIIGQLFLATETAWRHHGQKQWLDRRTV
jgi:cobalamin biosynthesis protein CobD/CbiB